MKEIHGLIVKKVEHAYADDEMSVRIYDGNDFVGLYFSETKNRPKLTYEEAIALAAQLREAAKRLQIRSIK